MKKNNNKTLVFAIFAIILTIIALIATSGTYAKYTSSIDTTEASATVAKWSVKVNDKDITKTSEPINFNIFDYIYDSDGTEIENDVSNNKIAPGTSGSFNFKIENLSEVNIKYSIEFTETNTSNIPIEYSLDQTTYYNAEGLTQELETNAQEIQIANEETITVYWRWAYDSNDTTDTALGVAAQNTGTLPTYNVSATIIATQVD